MVLDTSSMGVWIKQINKRLDWNSTAVVGSPPSPPPKKILAHSKICDFLLLSHSIVAQDKSFETSAKKTPKKTNHNYIFSVMNPWNSMVLKLQENEEARYIWYMLDVLYNDAYNNKSNT